MKKRNIVYFMIGILLLKTIGVSANQYVAAENTYPIQLNGEDVSIEGYNIDGSTYFKLRDISDAAGGFDVGFSNNIIQISKDGYNYNNEQHKSNINYHDADYNFSLEIPADWEGLYEIETQIGGSNFLKRISFYEKQNYENIVYDFGDYLSHSGHLFSVYICDKNNVDDDKTMYGDSYTVLAEKDNLIVFSVTSLDVSTETEYIDSWMHLMNDKERICNTFTWDVENMSAYSATENTFPVQLNGENVFLEGYNINGSTYFKLRDIASIIGGFDVDFKNNIIQLSKGGYAYSNPLSLEKYIGSYELPTVDSSGEIIGGIYLTITEITSEKVVFYYDTLNDKRIIYRGPFYSTFVDENTVTGSSVESYYGNIVNYSLTFNEDEIIVKDIDHDINSTFNINTNRVEMLNVTESH